MQTDTIGKKVFSSGCGLIFIKYPFVFPLFHIVSFIDHALSETDNIIHTSVQVLGCIKKETKIHFSSSI